MKEVVLISGGTGLIGKKLSRLLSGEGYEVWVLSRSKKPDVNIPGKIIQWDVVEGTIEDFDKRRVSHIIHLAGAGIADKRWTEHRKETIRNSRVKSADLLYQTFRNHGENLKSFISASGINYYGTKTVEHIFREEDPPGNDFLGKICADWEAAGKKFKSVGCRVVHLRTGIVLAEKESALQQMALPVKWGLGSPIGSGRQYMPWIHLDDIVGMYLYAVQNKLNGPYNASAPQHIRNEGFMKKLAHQLHRPFFMPKVPAFTIKLVMGKMADIVLKGSRASTEKILREGFQYEYEKLSEALEEIYG